MSNKIRNLTERNQFERKKNKERKVEPSEIPKLSLSNLQQNQGGSGQVGGYRGGGGGGSGYNYHEESPPLHKRDVDKVDKGYPIINETKTSHNSHSHSHNNNNNNNNSNKFNSSGKYPPLAKTSEYFSESFQDDVNYIVRSRENRDQRKMGSKLPPRDLKPINHVPNTLNDKLQMDQHHHHQHHNHNHPHNHPPQQKLQIQSDNGNDDQSKKGNYALVSTQQQQEVLTLGADIEMNASEIELSPTTNGNSNNANSNSNSNGNGNIQLNGPYQEVIQRDTFENNVHENDIDITLTDTYTSNTPNNVNELEYIGENEVKMNELSSDEKGRIARVSIGSING
mmetsp:Transcript_7721/g.8188  ORF Transcript_7721/g.8188 Transcript_7721/m.8188 type:complete len:339 (+) Transcript_7721:68-1084(+)